jgi:hypothetical protein
VGDGRKLNELEEGWKMKGDSGGGDGGERREYGAGMSDGASRGVPVRKIPSHHGQKYFAIASRRTCQTLPNRLHKRAGGRGGGGKGGLCNPI